MNVHYFPNAPRNYVNKSFFSWSRERAIEYMLNYTAFPEAGITNEIHRYMTWPGQACSYKIGELKIRELRNKAEKELGKIATV